MNRRPLSVTLIGCVFAAAGVIGFVYHVTEFHTQGPFDYRLVGISLVRLVAVVGGVFLLRGKNWARWLLLAWIAFHVVISALHSLPELIVHAVLLLLVAYFLFRPGATAYFRGIN